MLISRQAVIPVIILLKEKMNKDKEKKLLINLSIDVWCRLTILKTIYLNTYATVTSV